MFLYKWLSLATILVVTPWAETLKFSNNRYESLLVAIGPRVKPDPNIIRELISMLRQGSQYLHRATRERAYIGSVKILVPDTWQPDPNWSAAVGETFEEADIRVDHENPIHGSDPYTFQPGHCGEPGRYIHLTPGYLTDRNNDRDVNYGNMGRSLVHEFAHLRYGVFDEYGLGTPEYPDVYLEDSTLYPTGCTATLDQGEYQGNCSIDPHTNRPGESCYFLPSRDKNTASASIMYDTTVNKVTHFCESNSDDPDLVHNPLAPNQQNKMCNNRGTWNVIMDHPDFKEANRPINKTAKELGPSIEFLYKPKVSTGPRACGRPVVLVLDVSGSMTSNNRYFKQTQTADKLIRDVLPAGTKVGVVTFSSFAQVAVNMTTIHTSGDRDRIANKLPGVEAYNGFTAIGQGLLVAKRMLDTAGETGNGRIVLITDGMENEQPFVEDVKGEITASGIRVHSLAYSVDAAPVISALSSETGGMYAYYTESPTSSILDGIIERLMTDISVCVQLERIEIMRRALLVSPGVEVRQYVDIDSTVGNDTIFVFTLPHGVDVDVTLISPSGASYTSGSTESSFDVSLNIKRFRFEVAENGTWLCSLRSTGSGSAILVVKSLPTDDPYEVQSWMSSMFSDASYGSKPTVVYVHVHKGYNPVVHADVTVTVERPMATPVVLKPRDDGKFADTMANDGVYSAYFTQYTGNQRYSLDVGVSSTAQTGFLTGGVQYGGARSRFHNTTKPPVFVPAENFTRTSSPGAMDVKGFVPDKDNFSPSTINDLRVINTDRKLHQVTLTWTAPGDDLDQGTASRYDMRISRTSRDILHDFSSSQKVGLALIVSGSLIPQIAGSTETMTMQVPSNWTTVVLAIQTIDEANHVSDTSNLATSTFEVVKLKGYTTTTTTSPPDVTMHQIEDDSVDNVVIIAVVASVLGAVVIGGTASIIYLYHKYQTLAKTNPFTADMTEPSVPNVRFTYGTGRAV